MSKHKDGYFAFVAADLPLAVLPASAALLAACADSFTAFGRDTPKEPRQIFPRLVRLSPLPMVHCFFDRAKVGILSIPCRIP